jgi:hypothetical protein
MLQSVVLVVHTVLGVEDHMRLLVSMLVVYGPAVNAQVPSILVLLP